MKPFLGVNLTSDKKNEQANGSEFIIQKPSDFLVQSLERASNSVGETIKNSGLPLFVRIIEWVCIIAGGTSLIGIAKSVLDEDGVTLSVAYQNASWLFWVGGACLAVGIILAIIAMRRTKSVLESEESEQVFADLGEVVDNIFAELGVPPEAKDVDVLSFNYIEKDGKIKVREKDMQLAPYINTSFSAFSDSQNLYLADTDGKYAFPLDSLKAIRTVKKTIRIDEWIKDEECNKGIYKQYKLSEDNYGGIICKVYHILEIEKDGEHWELYFPCYELPVFEELTGLTATEV